MTYEAGIVQESIKYARGNALPVLWVVESNGLSVGTPTRETWKLCSPAEGETIIRYHYDLTRPHVGIGKHVQF